MGKTTPSCLTDAVAYVIDDRLCPVTRLELKWIKRDLRGSEGRANVSGLLESDAEKFFRFAMPRWMKAAEKTEPGNFGKVKASAPARRRRYK